MPPDQPRRSPHLTYGPYGSAGHALVCCQRFVMSGFPSASTADLGIIWMEPAGSAVLRAPGYDQEDNLGASIVVQWHGPIPPQDPPSTSGINWQSIDDVVSDVYRKLGSGLHAFSGQLSAEDQSLRSNFGIAAPAIEHFVGLDTFLELREAWRFAERELAAHPTAAAIGATILDAVGIIGVAIGALALLPEIATIGGVTALVGAGAAGLGSGLLAVADGFDAYLLLRGDKAAADDWEESKFFRRTELLAPLLVIPDAARSGLGVAQEVGRADKALRVAQATTFDTASQEARAAAKIEAQKAADTLKPKIYKGDREKLHRMVQSAKSAAKRVRKAEKIRTAKESELRSVILKSLKRDGPGLLSAVGGSGLYVGICLTCFVSRTRLASGRRVKRSA